MKSARSSTRPLGALLMALALLASPAAAAPLNLEGLVTQVADGDTLTVLDGTKTPQRIRLLGIDAPEGGQAYGKVARQVLRNKVIGRNVTVLARSRDRYGRLVGKVLLAGSDVNLELVREGLAWHYKRYAGDQYPGDARLYAQAEEGARRARQGLWAEPEPKPPWLWRRAHPRPD